MTHPVATWHSESANLKKAHRQPGSGTLPRAHCHRQHRVISVAGDAVPLVPVPKSCAALRAADESGSVADIGSCP